MTRPIRDLDVPETVLRQRIRELVARQRKQGTGLADRSAERLGAVLAPTPDPTAEEAS